MRTIRLRQISLALIMTVSLLVAVASPALAQSPVTAEVDRNRLSTSETVTLSITINARNAGGLVLAHQTFCVIEVQPAAYIVLAANEAEKAAGITLNHYTGSGAYGRLMISGTESAVMQSRDAAISAIESLDGRSAP